MAPRFPPVFTLIFLATLACPSLGSNDFPKTSKELHKHARSLASRDELAESLQYFRAAVRGDPNSAKYLNDLGVTEMRLGQFSKAGSRFLEAGYLSGGSYRSAADNLEELKQYIAEEDWVGIEEEWWKGRVVSGKQFPETSVNNYHNNATKQPLQRHKTRPLPQITYESLQDRSNATAAAYLLGDIPYLLTGAMASWDLSAFDADNLRSTFGGARVDYYPHNMAEETVHPFFSTLDHALANFDEPSGLFETVDASVRNTYIQWNVKYHDWETLKSIGMKLPPMFTSDDDWIGECFDNDAATVDSFHVKTHWRMVLIGQIGAGMFNHKDTLQSSSFQAQVTGRKRWHLCHNNQSKNIYTAGDVNTFAPDYDKFTKALELDCYDQVIEPGEMLYYPQNYWHQTMNLSPVTTSISGTLVTKSNVKGITKEFKRECEPGAKVRIFVPEEKLCNGLSKCYDLWKNKGWEEDVARQLAEVAKGPRKVGGEL